MNLENKMFSLVLFLFKDLLDILYLVDFRKIRNNFKSSLVRKRVVNQSKYRSSRVERAFETMPKNLLPRSTSDTLFPFIVPNDMF